MDAMVEGVIVIDKDGTIELFNKAAESIFGYSAVETIGKNVNILMPEQDHSRHHSYIERYLETRSPRIIGIGREVQGKRRDGSLFPMDLAVAEVGWKESVRFIGVIRDLTEQKSDEEQLLRRREDMLRASRLTTMGEMTAAMAHELNQPLTAIANYASASLRLLNTDVGDDVREALKSIAGQAHRAGEIIRRLRNFVRSDPNPSTDTSVTELIEEIKPLAELDAKANNIALTVDLPKDLPKVVVDQLQIQQVLLNLVRNGIDAMHEASPSNRRLTVSARLTAPDFIRVDVTDHGHGVPNESKDQLFNAFFTTKRNGMGMGLAISRTIVHSHGGELTFINNADAGATFSFTLPTKIED
jgi:two-component system sensor kinase FixL